MASLTRVEICRLLTRRGLNVQPQDIANDVSRNFIPGLADPLLTNVFILRRAERLYRLRRRGAVGDVLRILLFIADGWGWESIRKVCLEGLSRASASSQTGLRDVIRKPTPESLDFVAAEVAERQRVHLLERMGLPESADVQVREKTIRFTLGALLFGKPLPGGSLTSLGPLIEFLDPSKSGRGEEAMELVELFAEFFGLSVEQMSNQLRQANVHEAAEASRLTRESMLRLRRAVWRAAKTDRGDAVSSNPLTFFGLMTSTCNEPWPNMPQRMTAAQFIGGTVAVHVLAVHAINSFFDSPLGEFTEAIAKNLFENQKGASNPL